MAVAVKTSSAEPTGQQGLESRPAMGLAGVSLLGTAYIWAAFLASYHLVPWAWRQFAVPRNISGLFSQGFQGLLMLAAAAAFALIWMRILRPAPQPGARAGIFVGAASVLAGLAVVFGVAKLIGGAEGELSVAAAIPAAVAVGLGFLLVRALNRESFQAWLRSVEEQGWFTVKPYKKLQGLHIRRGTLVGLLALVGSGLWLMTQRRNLFAAGDWIVNVPWVGERVIFRSAAFTVPFLMALVAIWFAWRLVNYPRFADFLIATEAEMNKVSWTSRKRLYQDTIVVLSTVAFMTIFLLVVDLVLSFFLRDVFGVINR